MTQLQTLDVGPMPADGRLSPEQIEKRKINALIDFLNQGGDGSFAIRSAEATPAGGSATARLLFGTTAGFGIYFGSGVPSVAAAQGSLYIRSDGSSVSTRLYVNTNGSTGWTNFTSAA